MNLTRVCLFGRTAVAVGILLPVSVVMAAFFGFGAGLVLWTIADMLSLTDILLIFSTPPLGLLPVADVRFWFSVAVLGVGGLVAIPLWLSLISDAVHSVHDDLRDAGLPSESRDDGVDSTVADLARRAGTSPPAVAVIDSERPATYASGWNDAAVIAVTTGLVDLLSPGELEAVLAHQLCQVDGVDARVMGVGRTAAFHTSRICETEGLFMKPLTGVLIRPLLRASTFGMAILEHGRKYAADRRGAALLDDPGRLATALERIDDHRASASGDATTEGAAVEQRVAMSDILSPHGQPSTGHCSPYPPADIRIERIHQIDDV